ncbi:hypothetical protein POP12_193 [Pectobacterium phage POP12]|nr:hypothetical protein POP12_193 [Pectobacterium phage POP12]
MKLKPNPYNTERNPSVDFSESYYDKVVENFTNPLLISFISKCSVDDVDYLYIMLPIDPEFKIGCNERQAKNVLRYLVG